MNDFGNGNPHGERILRPLIISWLKPSFLDVVRDFKSKAGKELMEDLKAIQTMQDKFVNNRYSEKIF